MEYLGIEHKVYEEVFVTVADKKAVLDMVATVYNNACDARIQASIYMVNEKDEREGRAVVHFDVGVGEINVLRRFLRNTDSSELERSLKEDTDACVDG